MRDRERERECKKKKRELAIKREKKLRLWYETVRLKICKKEGESVTERERRKKSVRVVYWNTKGANLW